MHTTTYLETLERLAEAASKLPDWPSAGTKHERQVLSDTVGDWLDAKWDESMTIETSKISQFDRDHIGDILRGMGDWFSAKLIRLLATCDPDNLEAFRVMYPDHVEAWEIWRTEGDKDGD